MEHPPRPPFALAADLPEVIAFAGEFGAEINSFLPFVYWLHQAGLMRGRRVRSYGGMRPFYYFLAPDQLEERAGPRAYSFPVQRPDYLPNRDDHAARRSPFELFPDFRARYRDPRLAGDRPLMIVHNKYSVEWDRAPVNFIDPATLSEIFGSCCDQFRIVYLRPGITAPPSGYCGDHQPDLAFGDLDIVRQHRDVILFEDLAAEQFPGLSYNEAKLRLYASAHHHVTVQGGNAHLTALFSGNLVSILHRYGNEIRQSYATGHFARAATPAPTYLICRTQATLLESLAVLQMSEVAGDRVLISPAMAPWVTRLSPAQQCGERLIPVPA